MLEWLFHRSFSQKAGQKEFLPSIYYYVSNQECVYSVHSKNTYYIYAYLYMSLLELVSTTFNNNKHQAAVVLSRGPLNTVWDTRG